MKIVELFLAGMMRTRILREIHAERDRQFYTEGFGLSQDDSYENGELARAAGVYALCAGNPDPFTLADAQARGWPWSASWWKPKTCRHDLIRAAALCVAEIERLDRAANRARSNA